MTPAQRAAEQDSADDDPFRLLPTGVGAPRPNGRPHPFAELLGRRVAIVDPDHPAHDARGVVTHCELFAHLGPDRTTALIRLDPGDGGGRVRVRSRSAVRGLT